MKFLRSDIHLNCKGQLTLGLAFGFTMMLALFAFVFNTSMNVREKIKLQQTTDFGVLVAANAQRKYLDIIRDYNIAIEAQWFSHLALLQNNHCVQPLPGFTITAPNNLPGATDIISIQNVAQAYITRANISAVSYNEFSNDASLNTGDYCDYICNKYNDAVNSQIRKRYASMRTIIKNQIINLILNANQDAHQYALHHFLQPSNLPWGLQLKLRSVLGDSYTATDTLAGYQNNLLNIDANNGEWGYEVASENKNDPLFVPGDESRPFIFYKHYFYQDSRAAPTDMTQVCRVLGPIGGIKSMNSSVKVVKTGSYETHFFSGINYLPPSNLFENNEALVKRKTNPDELGASENRLRDPSLLSRRSAMVTRSAAKPFGGSFPAAVTSNLTSFISSLLWGGNANTPPAFTQGAGKEFKGAKLFGIADSFEIGGYPIARANLETETLDEQGNVQSIWKILQEDYLH